MKFFFPDSSDLVDPSFDFQTETRNADRNTHFDDLYAHEVFEKVPFDGLLVSKGIVDGFDSSSRYTVSQRHRLLRWGVREFFRLNEEGRHHLQTMGDCGAFSYVKRDEPPYTVDDVIEFYETLGFDFGISIDHIILGFKPEYDNSLPGVDDNVPPHYRSRQQVTLDLAAAFWERCLDLDVSFTPVGVAQGWSPQSYARAVEALQRIGYQRIALGGLVPLKTPDILKVVDAAAEVRDATTEFHLLGVTRIAHLSHFADCGVVSFDSTSPLRQAFKDDTDNYHTPDGAYTALRVPQVEKNVSLKRRIEKGLVRSEDARALEQESLRTLFAFEKGEVDVETTLDVVHRYMQLYGGKDKYLPRYRTLLEDRPWEQCPCDICAALGINVVIFRGAERNRRRGFHNLYVFSNKVHSIRALMAAE